MDDSDGFGLGITASVTLGKFTTTSPTLNGTQVNNLDGSASSYSGYGSAVNQTCCADGKSWKEFGLTILPAQSTSGEVMLMSVNRQSPDSPYCKVTGGLVKSYDYGATWTNWLHPANSGLTSGDPPNPATSDMFSSYNTSGQFSVLVPVLYAPGGVSIGANPDNQNTYVYFWVPPQPSGCTYTGGGTLLRVARSTLENLNPSDYQAFTGGDGSSDSSWSSTLTSAAALSTDSHFISESIQCGLSVGCLAVGWSGTSFPYTWYWYTAPHVWGPWTLRRTDTGRDTVAAQVLASSVTNDPILTFLSSGDSSTYSTCHTSPTSSGCKYQIWYNDFDISSLL